MEDNSDDPGSPKVSSLSSFTPFILEEDPNLNKYSKWHWKPRQNYSLTLPNGMVVKGKYLKIKYVPFQRSTNLYKAVRAEDRTKVFIRITDLQGKSKEEIELLSREADCMELLDHPFVIKYIE